MMDMKAQPFVKLENDAFFSVVKQRLNQGEQVWIPVVGKSMEPFLREGDRVLLRAVREVGVGDIVLAHWRSRYVLHRIVFRKNEELWLAGDNNLVQIEEIGCKDLIALAAGARRGEVNLRVCGGFYKLLGKVWYHTRLPRRVAAAVKARWRRLGT